MQLQMACNVQQVRLLSRVRSQIMTKGEQHERALVIQQQAARRMHAIGLARGCFSEVG